MAIQGPIPVLFEQAFPYGAYLASEVAEVFEWVNGVKRGQAKHPVTGDLMWTVTVIDADPTLKASMKSVAVKIAAKHRPVPPNSVPGHPFTPVEFSSMTAKPYVGGDDNFKRIIWTYEAREMLPASPADN